MYYISVMATKTVALDEEAYEMLRREKRPDESFSDVVKRVARKRKPLTDFAGVWKDYPAADFEKFQEWRRWSRQADVRRQRRLLEGRG